MDSYQRGWIFRNFIAVEVAAVSQASQPIDARIFFNYNGNNRDLAINPKKIVWNF